MGFFPYPGGKAEFAKRIYRHFADHDVYVEAFGGAAGVLFGKPRSDVEIYNDINGDVWNFFDVFSRRPHDLIDRLEDVYYAKEQFDRWSKRKPHDPVDRAARFFFMRYANFGSKMGISGFRRMNHRSVADHFRDAVESLDEKRKRLHRVTIENIDYTIIVDKYDGDRTLFYFDPPYAAPTDDPNYYLYESEDAFDPDTFVDVLDSIDGYWVVSYDTVPERRPESLVTVESWSTKNRIAKGQSAPKDRDEYLLFNYDPKTVPLFDHAEQTNVAQF